MLGDEVFDRLGVTHLPCESEAGAKYVDHELTRGRDRHSVVVVVTAHRACSYIRIYKSR